MRRLLSNPRSLPSTSSDRRVVLRNCRDQPRFSVKRLLTNRVPSNLSGEPKLKSWAASCEWCTDPAIGRFAKNSRTHSDAINLTSAACVCIFLGWRISIATRLVLAPGVLRRSVVLRVTRWCKRETNIMGCRVRAFSVPESTNCCSMSDGARR